MEPLDDLDDIKAFLIESYENLNQIERDIIDLEKTSAKEILVRIYRNIHTIKGNCGFLAFPKLESVAHAGENLLSCLSEGKLVVNLDITNTLLHIVDSIRQLLNNIEASGEEGEGDYSNLIEKLTNLSKATQIPNEEFASSFSPALDKSASESSIRVDINLLNQVMNLVGELVLARNQVVQFANNLEDTTFSNSCQHLDAITTELYQKLMKTRLQPINTIWQNFPRMVRDLAKACGKQVRVETEGAETEIDRSMIEAIKDPLTHLVRNCIDHGIETPSIRTLRGKPLQGRLFLRARHENGKVSIEIGDDGNGIDADQLKQKAQQLGLLTTSQASEMSDLEAVNLIFLPRFSTTENITNISGRGVGMSIVKSNIQKINGTIDVQTQLEHGTIFKIKIPLTLAITSALIVTSGNNHYAIIQGSIQELVQLEKQVVETFYDVPVFRLRGKVLPLVYLNKELQFQEKTAELETLNIIVIQAEEYAFGLVVDEINDTENIVVKPLGTQLQNVITFTGATILGDGKIALIIDVIALANRSGVKPQTQKLLSDTTTKIKHQEENSQMILLFDAVSGARMAIPLTFAYRLEEFSNSMVEKVGKQYVIKYRNMILPLFFLNTVFSGKFNVTKDTIEVVVVNFHQHSVGLVVDSIIDIVEEPITVKGAGTRQGILYLAMIQGQVTEILDIENVIKMINPHFFNCAST